MAEEQQFCLRWNNFQVNITSQFETLRDDEDFVDVTLACEGKRLKAHKVVLSACSPYFKDLFKSNPCKHPILFMRDVEFHHLQSLVEFMYAGEVNIAQAQLSAFLRTAESLQIRGLTEAPQRHKQMDGQSSGRSGSVAGSSKWGGGSPGGGSRTPSPEEAEQEGEEEMLSLSPPCSPPPAKRSCPATDKSSGGERTEDSGNSGGNHRSHSNQYENVKNETMDMIEPKLEVPDYCSDGEGRTDYKSMPGAYQGMDNSVEMTQSFQGLQGGGGMDMLPGPSAQNYMGDTSQDAAQADQRKLHSLDPRPCPICYRMYSNLSNLRQHLRLIHNPQTVSCPLCSKPFKTKLYLKRHLMSFHELVCTTPKAGSAVNAASIKGEFYTYPQMPLGKIEQPPGDDRNGVQNPTSPAKTKDTSAQELVAELFQTRNSYPGTKGGNVGGNIQKAKIIGHNEDKTNFQASSDVGQYQIRNQDRYRHQHVNKNQDVSNYLPSGNNDNRYSASSHSRNVSNDRSVQYHPQSGSSQDGTPPFLNLLSLTKSEENISYMNPQLPQADESEKGSDNASVEQESNNDVALT